MLLVDWDPIGILGFLRPLDEYDSYAAGVADLLLSGASREQIIAHLDSIEKQTMGLRGERPAQAAVADKLLLIHKTNTQYEAWRVEN